VHPLCFALPRDRPRVRTKVSKVFWVGVFLVVLEKEGTSKAGEKCLFLPLPCASRGRRKATVPFKTAPLWAFPFF